jgi:hypothetical protein
MFYYIDTNDKIMIVANNKPNEIVNDTGFLPLACHSDVFLMSNYKLYKVINLSLQQIGSDYVVDSNDFTDRFVQINSEFYEIIGTTLRKIVIKPKNCLAIITDQRNCYYIDTNNKLLLCRYYKLDAADINSLFLDSDVDLTLYCTGCYVTGNSSYVVCSKANKIVCYEILRTSIQLPTLSSNIELIGDTHHIFNINIRIIDYDGTIIKSMHEFFLDSDNNLYMINQSQISSVYVDYYRYNFTVKLTDIPVSVRDFNVSSSGFIYLDADNKIYSIIEQIDRGYFKKRISRVKSAHT